MRIVFLGSGGEYSARVLDGLAASHPVLCAILPPPPPGWKARLLTWHLSRWMRRSASRHAVPVRRVRRALLAPALRELAPDLIAVASYPALLPPEVLAVPHMGCLNVHPSLLPRHRGADPVFWMFRHDDREAGVSVHWMNEAIDEGEIVAQRSVALDDGTTRRELTARLGEEGGGLLAMCVSAVAAGTAQRISQDAGVASHDPLPTRADLAIPYDEWRVDRVWRFLRGVGTQLLRDRGGNRLRVGDAARWVRQQHEREPGTFDGVRLYCLDGWITFDAIPLRRRLAAMLFQSA